MCKNKQRKQSIIQLHILFRIRFQIFFCDYFVSDSITLNAAVNIKLLIDLVNAIKTKAVETITSKNV